MNFSKVGGWGQITPKIYHQPWRRGNLPPGRSAVPLASGGKWSQLFWVMAAPRGPFDPSHPTLQVHCVLNPRHVGIGFVFELLLDGAAAFDADAEVEELDPQGEGHREVDVALVEVGPGPFGDQHHADKN